MSLLNQVQTGRKQIPVSLLFYGVHGIGKSKFGESTEKPIFVGSEENDELDAPRFPQVKTWEDLTKQLATLRDESHGYKTLVIDAIDTLQQVAETEILSHQPGKTMATAFGGYGKAYEKMQNMFLDIRDNYLKPIRNKMHVVLLCHSEKVKHEDPITVTAWDHYKPSLHKKVAPIFEDWVSAILFANYYLVRSETEDGKEYAEGDGTRIIYTEERPSHVSKNRFKLPYKMKFEEGKTWDVLKKHIDNFYQANKNEKLDVDNLGYAKELMLKAPEDLQPKIEASLNACKNNEELNRIVKKLEGLTKNE
jgi:hypothetical protein